MEDQVSQRHKTRSTLTSFVVWTPSRRKVVARVSVKEVETVGWGWIRALSKQLVVSKKWSYIAPWRSIGVGAGSSLLVSLADSQFSTAAKRCKPSVRTSNALRNTECISVSSDIICIHPLLYQKIKSNFWVAGLTVPSPSMTTMQKDRWPQSEKSRRWQRWQRWTCAWYYFPVDCNGLFFLMQSLTPEAAKNVHAMVLHTVTSSGPVMSWKPGLDMDRHGPTWFDACPMYFEVLWRFWSQLEAAGNISVIYLSLTAWAGAHSELRHKALSPPTSFSMAATAQTPAVNYGSQRNKHVAVKYCAVCSAPFWRLNKSPKGMPASIKASRTSLRKPVTLPTFFACAETPHIFTSPIPQIFCSRVFNASDTEKIASCCSCSNGAPWQWTQSCLNRIHGAPLEKSTTRIQRTNSRSSKTIWYLITTFHILSLRTYQ